MYLKNLIAGLLLFAAFPACAQNLNRAKMDSLLDELAKHDKGMVSLALMQDGAIVYQKAVGIKAPGMASDIHTRYRIGSISKMFTASMIFQLVDENKLTLGTPLSAFFPQLPNAGKITIEMMLGHRSGLHNFTNDSTYVGYSTKPHTEAEMLAIFAAEKPDFEPNTKADYSNTNFVLLGYIVEKVTGQPYAKALKARITNKLGLKETYYGGKANAAADEARSFSYENGWKLMPETDMSIPGGAGSIVSTPSDLVKFLDGLFNGKLFNITHLEQMKNIRDGYGLALFKMPFYDKTGYGHNGGIDGFLSTAAYFPDQKFTVAYTSNGLEYAMNDLLIGILSIYFNRPYTIPSFEVKKVDEALVKDYLGTYSSPGFPLKITLSYENGTFKGQGSGQGAFPLEQVDDHTFVFKPAGVTIILNPADHSFVLQQGGGSHEFKKDEAK